MKRELRRNPEEGFTLLELIIVVIIAGILSAIGILVFSKQSHAAIVATVKSDVADNKSQIVNERPTSNNPSGLYIHPDQFESKAVRTSDNTVGYTVSPDYTQACTWGSYTFSETDSFFYHFSTETGKMVEGKCDSIAGWITVIIPPEGTEPDPENQLSNPEEETPTLPEPPTEPTAPQETPEEENQEEETPTLPEPEDNPYGFYTSDGRLNIDVRLRVNSRNKVCFEAEVSTESTSPVKWDVKIDRTVEPIRGNHFGSEITSHGKVNIDQGSAVATLTNKPWVSDTVVAGSPIIIENICVYGLNVTNAGVMRTPQQVTFIPQPVSGGAWFASQTFTITGTGQFWGIWEGEVDLSELETTANKSANPTIIASDPQHLKLEHISGHRYKVSLQDVPNNMYRLVKQDESLTIRFQK